MLDLNANYLNCFSLWLILNCITYDFYHLHLLNLLTNSFLYFSYITIAFYFTFAVAIV